MSVNLEASNFLLEAIVVTSDWYICLARRYNAIPSSVKVCPEWDTMVIWSFHFEGKPRATFSDSVFILLFGVPKRYRMG